MPSCQITSSSPVKAVKAAKTTHTSTSSSTVPSLLYLHVPSPATKPKTTSQPHKQGSGDLESPCPSSATPILPLLGVNAHLHVLELLKHTCVSSLSNALTQLSPPQSFQLDMLVPSYCWPNKWLQSTDTLPWEAKHIAIGWHPTCTNEFSSTSLQQFEATLNIPNVVALGEVGIDYHCEASPASRAQQKPLLSQMCKLTHQYDLPLVVHCHDPDDHQSTKAAEDCMAILSEHSYKYRPYGAKCLMYTCLMHS